MPKTGQSDGTGTPTAHCNECGWTWTLIQGTSDPGPCDSCGSLNATVAIPKQQRTKKQQF